MLDDTTHDRWMYDRAFDNYKLLADIRFKLLSIVPILSGLGVSLSASFAEPASRIAFGCIGAFVTLGIVFYDQRNSTHYDAAIDVAKQIEQKLLAAKVIQVGVFTTRAAVMKRRLFGLVDMWHDRALAMIYSAAFAGWAFVAGSGVDQYVGAGTSVVAGATGAVFIVALIQFRTWNRPKTNTPSPAS